MSKLERVGDPIRIIADTTRRCNLDCWYCHSASGPFYKGPELTGEDIVDIYNAAEKSGVFDVTITGGEPLMWNGLNEAMAASQDLEYPAVQLITNATVLTEKRLQTLKNGKLSRICVSLDGRKKTHEANRGKNTYERTLRGIQSLRKVVDNITVISVIDNTNFEEWPELTGDLIEMGAKQHHLAPVCFAGNAMEEFKGLTGDQFDLVRTTVNSLQTQLPESFILRFNDILINGPEGHTISLSAFTEGFKGWHLVVKPNGDVKTAVKAWGRSWRDNETIGNIRNENLTQIITQTGTKRDSIARNKFALEEERKRKFHLGSISQQEIQKDVERVKLTESGEMPLLNPEAKPKREATEVSDYEPIFYLPFPGSLAEVANLIKNQPGRYRVRSESEFGFLFDRTTFNITLFRPEDLEEVNRPVSINNQ